MSKFLNAEPLEIDFSIEEGQEHDKEILPDLIDEVEEEGDEQDPDQPDVPDKKSDAKPEVNLEVEDITLEDKDVEVPSDNSIYLNVINEMLETGIFDNENFYEGFTEETEPSPEVLKKFIEYNIELREQRAIEEFVSNISPIAQRILNFDINSDGKETSIFLKSLIEEDNIKSLNVENEYDQEKILRLWYGNEDWTPAEIEEKIADLKNASLLAKEATKIKPKLDAKAETIAKEQESAQEMLRNIEHQRKEQFFNKVESIVKTGKVDDLILSKEDAQKIMSLLLIDDVPVKLPEGRELKMNYLEAEIFRHKYSNTGNPNLLVQVAYLLSNPEKFYQQYANKVRTKEVNEFVKEKKFSVSPKSVPTKAKDKTNYVGWNMPSTNNIKRN